MRTVERACRRCVEILNEELDGTTARDLCLKKGLYFMRESGSRENTCKDYSRVVRMLENMAESEGATESTIKTILRIDKMSPGFWREVDLSVFHEAENIFYKTPEGFLNRRDIVAQEAAAMACAVYGYKLDGEWPVPLAHYNHGYTIIDRLAEVLDLDALEVATRFFNASKARKAAMVAVSAVAEEG